jgi:hypothetical protein
MKVGDIVRVLQDYNLFWAKVLRINKKSIKVEWRSGYTSLVKPERVAELDELIVVVWEQWVGVNGRGSHRIEREMYPQYRKPAKDWQHQSRINEEQYGVLDKNNPTHFL